jgi:hypothetical protein
MEYETVPLINGILYVPEQFEEAIHANLEYRAMKRKVEKNGRGEGLLRTYKANRNEAEIDAITDIEMPSFDQLLAIGKIWESKIPVSIQGGINNNFGKF